MTNPAFEAFTRNTAFNLSLSSAMCNTIMEHALADRLRAKYPWALPNTWVNFGTPEHAAAMYVSDRTNRALVRRGLLRIEIPETLPACRFDIVALTRAGELMADLLAEAGFALDPEHYPWLRVTCHPDDRIPVEVGAVDQPPTPRDRRLDMVEAWDRPWMSLLHEPEVVLPDGKLVNGTGGQR